MAKRLQLIEQQMKVNAGMHAGVHSPSESLEAYRAKSVIKADGLKEFFLGPKWRF